MPADGRLSPRGRISASPLHRASATSLAWFEHTPAAVSVPVEARVTREPLEALGGHRTSTERSVENAAERLISLPWRLAVSSRSRK